MKFWVLFFLIVCVIIVFFMGPCTYEYELYENEPVVLTVKK
jgi:hypothetical protein